ncbi:MAG: YjbH domain-containing protein [Pseudomonadota bacterium]
MGATRLFLAGLVSGSALATSAQDLVPYNLYGNPGLIDLPSAQMQRDGQLAVSFAGFENTFRSGINFQILPQISGTVRYSDVSGLGVSGIDREDRSYDLRFQLLEEGRYAPSIALGLRDLLGTSADGAEYLVATKTLGPVTVTGGLGWGRLGSAGGADNLFGADTRPATTDPDGRPQDQAWFRGDNAPFAGVVWRLPVQGLSVLAEYSSDDYTLAQEGRSLSRDSDFNFGVHYQPNEYVRLGLYSLYGSEVAAKLTITGNPRNALTPQDLGTAPTPLIARPDDAPRNTGWAKSTANRDALVGALQQVLAPDGIVLDEVRLSGTVAEIYIVNRNILREPKALGRTARALAAAMPPSVETFRITLVTSGLPTTTATIERSNLEAQVNTGDASLRSWQTTNLTDAAGTLVGEDVWRRDMEAPFSWSLNPTIPFSLFDDDEPVRADALLSLTGRYRISRGFSLNAGVSRWIIGNDQETVADAPGPLDQVRSDSKLYFSGRDVELDRLTADAVFKLSPQIYARATAGYLERMYGGLSTEILWAPTARPLALGAEVNLARKRAFDETFGFTDLEATTAFASVYWDTGFRGIEAQLDAGQYLAGDLGATVTLSRRFANGWDVSAYVTRTDVSAEDFGDGSFAKGVTISLPLRWGLPFETKSKVSLDLGAISRDGGARLRVPGRLYDRVRDTDRTSLRQSWSSFWQ